MTKKNESDSENISTRVYNGILSFFGVVLEKDCSLKRKTNIKEFRNYCHDLTPSCALPGNDSYSVK